MKKIYHQIFKSSVSSFARLSRHLISNGLLAPLQSGYRSNHSTETALLKLVNDLLCSTDEGKFSVLALLDLSSAFDTTDHEVLSKWLHDTYGIEGADFKWFYSYLSERTQPVSFCGRASRTHQLLYGVPQGSVLEPVLFTLYMQPLALVIRCHDVLYHFLCWWHCITYVLSHCPTWWYVWQTVVMYGWHQRLDSQKQT